VDVVDERCTTVVGGSRGGTAAGSSLGAAQAGPAHTHALIAVAATSRRTNRCRPPRWSPLHPGHARVVRLASA